MKYSPQVHQNLRMGEGGVKKHQNLSRESLERTIEIGKIWNMPINDKNNTLGISLNSKEKLILFLLVEFDFLCQGFGNSNPRIFHWFTKWNNLRNNKQTLQSQSLKAMAHKHTYVLLKSWNKKTEYKIETKGSAQAITIWPV